MKTYEAIAALEALNKITASVPLKFAYAAARNKRKLGEFVTTYEDNRRALLMKYGKKKEDGELDIDDIERAAAQFFTLLKGEEHAKAVFGYCCGRRQDTPEEHVDAVVELFLRAYARR